MPNISIQNALASSGMTYLVVETDEKTLSFRLTETGVRYDKVTKYFTIWSIDNLNVAFRREDVVTPVSIDDANLLTILSNMIFQSSDVNPGAGPAASVIITGPIPLPVSDNGSSLTVDGTVTALQGGGDWGVSLNTNNAGLATELTLDTKTGQAGPGAPAIAGTGIIGWLRAIYERLSTVLTITGSVTQSGIWTVSLNGDIATETTLSAINTKNGTEGAAPPLITGTGILGYFRSLYDRLLSILSTGGTESVRTEIVTNSAGLATELTLDTKLGTEGPVPPLITGTGVIGWLRAIYERLSGTITVSLANVATETTLVQVNNNLGTDGATPPLIAGTGIRGWLRAIYERFNTAIPTVWDPSAMNNTYANKYVNVGPVPIAINNVTILYGFSIINLNNAERYLKVFYQAASPNLNVDVSFITIPCNRKGLPTVVTFPSPIRIESTLTGVLWIAATNSPADGSAAFGGLGLTVNIFKAPYI